MLLRSRGAERTATFNLVVPGLVAALAAIGVHWYYTVAPSDAYSDFDQIWIAGRALMQGKDPYAEVPRFFPYNLYYPLPAVLCGLPFVLLPMAWARVVFASLTAGAFAAIVLRRRPHAWPWFLSFPFLYGVQRAQWTPLLVAASLTPFSGLLVCKPSIGLALGGSRPTKALLAGATGLLLLSFLVWPSWVQGWRDAIAQSPHLVAPALRPLGWLLVFAFLRWRTPEGRLLGLLACVPQTMTLYELLPLALIPRDWRSSALIALLTNLAYLGIVYGIAPSTEMPLSQFTEMIWPVVLVLVYLPTLAYVLWPLVPKPVRALEA